MCTDRLGPFCPWRTATGDGEYFGTELGKEPGEWAGLGGCGGPIPCGRVSRSAVVRTVAGAITYSLRALANGTRTDFGGTVWPSGGGDRGGPAARTLPPRSPAPLGCTLRG